MRKVYAVFAFVAMLLALLPRGHADPPSVDYTTPFHPDDMGEALVLDLAIVFISECGFNDPLEHAALGYTIARRARRMRRLRGWSARHTLRSIADRALVEPRTNRQRWLHAMRLDGGRPEGWSRWAHAPWAGTRSDGWKAAVEEARALVRGDMVDPCTGPSELWGSRRHPTDRATLIANLSTGTWAVVDCGLERSAHDNVYVRWGTRAERAAARHHSQRARSVVRYID